MTKWYHCMQVMIFFGSFSSIFSYDYDLIVIGGGLSGIQAARAALEHNKKIAIVEKSEIMSNHLLLDFAIKALSRIGFMGHQLRMACELGICTCTAELINKDHILPCVCTIIRDIQKNYLHNIFDDQRVSVLYGMASFVDKHTIQVDQSRVTAEKFIIATGKKKKALPDIKGINDVEFLTNTTFFTQKQLPKSIVIIGCDALAVELACSLAALGVQVTVIVKYGLLLPNFDYEVVDQLSMFMKSLGVTIELDTIVTSLKKDDCVYVDCTDSFGAKKTFCAQAIFVAQNGEPNVAGLGLDRVGVLCNKKGIVVDHTLKTNVDTIYACGDVTHCSDQLTRIADYQAKIAGYNVFCSYWKKKMHADYIHASRIVFSTIPLASSGLTEQEAIKRYGNQLQIYRIPYSQIDRAYIDSTTVGMGKFICNSDGVLVGAHVFGACAGELIDAIVIGKKLSEQFENYLFELRTPPSYFDLIWLAAEQSRAGIAKRESLLRPLFQTLQGYVW